jgi:hypothetical protein
MSDHHHNLGMPKSGDAHTARNFGASPTVHVSINGRDVGQLLTPSETALLGAFRASADTARADILAMAQAIAESCPEGVSRPALTLASINGKAHVRHLGGRNAAS